MDTFAFVFILLMGYPTYIKPGPLSLNGYLRSKNAFITAWWGCFAFPSFTPLIDPEWAMYDVSSLHDKWFGYIVMGRKLMVANEVEPPVAGSDSPLSHRCVVGRKVRNHNPGT